MESNSRFQLPGEPTFLSCVPIAGCLWLAGLVSPDVMLGCNHRSTSGVVVFPGGQKANIINQASVGTTDIRVYVLDKELDLEPLPIASNDFYKPLKGRGTVYAFYLNRMRQLGVAKYSRLGAGNILLSPVSKVLTIPTHVGDSGCPVTCWEYGRYALATHWFEGMKGPAYGPDFERICATAKELGAKHLPILNKRDKE